MTQTENRINNIANLLKNADKNIKKAQRLLDSLSQDVLESYDDVPGTLGIFDGNAMVTPEGKSYDVNPNYAAKSMLVVGDNLKMVEDNDKTVFKQISKVPRKRVAGILNKKEGNWYALTDTGSYQLLDVAVDFRDGEINDEVVVLIPEENLDASYAALEKLMRDGEEKKPGKGKESGGDSKEPTKKEDKDSEKKEEVKEEKKKAPAKKKVEKKEEKKPAKKKDNSEKKAVTKETDKKEKEEKKPAKKTATKAKTTSKKKTVLEDDDLV